MEEHFQIFNLLYLSSLSTSFSSTSFVYLFKMMNREFSFQFLKLVKNFSKEIQLNQIHFYCVAPDNNWVFLTFIIDIFIYTQKTVTAAAVKRWSAS